MSPKNEVNPTATTRSVLRSVRPAIKEELGNLSGLPGPEQKAVKDLVAKIKTLDDAGMHSSARRLESQALQTVRRYRGAAKKGPNWLTGV